MKKGLPRCNHAPGCFACKDGICRILKSTNFGDKACPFFKTQEQGDAEKARVMERLIAEGRNDLIELYYPKLGGMSNGS